VSDRPRRALITGLTGQDGSFLAELLLAKGYEIFGFVRRERLDNLGPAEAVRGRVRLIPGDVLLDETLISAVREVRPHEVYHLAAPTVVPDSWRDPALTLRAIAGSTAVLLETITAERPSARLLVASSGEMFGDTPDSPQSESTPPRPRTPYGVAKLAAHQLVGQLRERNGIFACSGILFNHESERRPENFVSRKITHGAATIKLGLADELILGDLDAVRDWSFAGDIVRGCWLMLQQETPRDYVLASGEKHTVRDLLQAAFTRVGLDPDNHVRIDSSLVRKSEPVPMVGDPRRARSDLDWSPSLTFEQMIARMVDADLRALTATKQSSDGS
jgi:GDPmannose 4,6-dehydratase